MADQRHDWGPLVGDLAARKERALGDGRRPKLVERQRSLGKLTVRERLDLLLDPGTWVEYGLLADHMDAGSRRPLPRGRRRGHRRRRDRRPARRGRGVRLHRDGRIDGRGRREQDRAHARARAAPAHPVRLAARLGRRAHPVDERLDVRRRGRAVPRAGRDERRRADGRGDARPLRGRAPRTSRRSPTSCRW